MSYLFRLLSYTTFKFHRQYLLNKTFNFINFLQIQLSFFVQNLLPITESEYPSLSHALSDCSSWLSQEALPAPPRSHCLRSSGSHVHRLYTNLKKRQCCGRKWRFIICRKLPVIKTGNGDILSRDQAQFAQSVINTACHNITHAEDCRNLLFQKRIRPTVSTPTPPVTFNHAFFFKRDSLLCKYVLHSQQTFSGMILLTVR